MSQKDSLVQKLLQKDLFGTEIILVAFFPKRMISFIKSHGVHFTLTYAEAITGPIQSFHEFRAMAYVTCHLVADEAWSNTPVLWLDWAEQLISLVWVPKQILSGYFETRLHKIVTAVGIYRCVYAEI